MPRSNPAWSNQLLQAAWAHLEALVGPSWMPRAARTRRGVLAEEHGK